MDLIINNSLENLRYNRDYRNWAIIIQVPTLTVLVNKSHIPSLPQNNLYLYKAREREDLSLETSMQDQVFSALPLPNGRL